MANKQNYLGEFEHVTLLGIMQLDDNAYGVTIRQYLKDSINRDVALGALYSTIERLEKKGLVATYKGEAKAERGGKAKKMVKVTAQGVSAIRSTKEQFRILWQGVNLMEYS